jgi:hypothetical protein
VNNIAVKKTILPSEYSLANILRLAVFYASEIECYFNGLTVID